MHPIRAFLLMMALALAGALVTGVAAASPAGNVAAGKQLYVQRCSICHGLGADGEGTADAGSFLEPQAIRPADLTALRRQNQGIFPEARVARAVFNDGLIAFDRPLPAMPGWGDVFYQLKGDRKTYEQRARDVAAYIETLQVR